MSESVEEHRASAPAMLNCAIVTVSDTRTLETDTGGATAAQLVEAAGHRVAERRLVRDEPMAVASTVRELANCNDVDAVLLTGGTGISHRDQTCETLNSLIEKPLPGYGELFRMLSFQEIGPAAMLSRATAGLVGRTVVVSMPGSPAAVRLALEKLILPELGHLVREARR